MSKKHKHRNRQPQTPNNREAARETQEEIVAAEVSDEQGAEEIEAEDAAIQAEAVEETAVEDVPEVEPAVEAQASDETNETTIAQEDEKAEATAEPEVAVEAATQDDIYTDFGYGAAPQEDAADAERIEQVAEDEAVIEEAVEPEQVSNELIVESADVAVEPDTEHTEADEADAQDTEAENALQAEPIAADADAYEAQVDTAEDAVALYEVEAAEQEVAEQEAQDAESDEVEQAVDSDDTAVGQSEQEEAEPQEDGEASAEEDTSMQGQTDADEQQDEAQDPAHVFFGQQAGGQYQADVPPDAQAEIDVQDVDAQDDVAADDSAAEQSGQDEAITDDAAGEGEDSEEETAEDAEGNDIAEGETDDDEAARIAAEKAAKKAERKAKTKAWVAKHKALIIILCVVVLLGAGMATGHFVCTRNVAFIHKVEDLQKAMDAGKKTEYIFKSDVVYAGDLALSNVNLDMNKHTLEVQGNLTYTGDAIVGNKPTVWSHPQVGGTVVVAGAYQHNGNVEWYSDLTAQDVHVGGDYAVYGALQAQMVHAEGAFSAVGTVTADMVSVAGELTVSGTVDATVEMMAAGATADIDGSVRTLMGGANTVVVKGSVQTLTGAEKLYLYPDSNVGIFEGVQAYYFVQYLEAPTVVVSVAADASQVLLISHVRNADGYKVTIGGRDDVIDVADASADKDNTVCKLPNLDPGDYTFVVTPYSNQSDVYLSQASTSVKVSYYVQLVTPDIYVAEEAAADGSTRVVLHIAEVPNAKTFVIGLRGNTYKIDASNGETIYDITDKLDGVGSYDVSVYATPPKKGNYRTSETALITYVSHRTTSATATVSVVGGQWVVTAEGDSGVYYYLVEWQQNGVTVDSMAVKAENGQATCSRTVDGVCTSVKVTPLAKGYYENGTATVLPLASSAGEGTSSGTEGTEDNE